MYERGPDGDDGHPGSVMMRGTTAGTIGSANASCCISRHDEELGPFFFVLQ